MRNENRIYPFLYELGEVWRTSFCDIRFGQLMSNFMLWVQNVKNLDVFYLEEHEILRLIKEYAGGNKNEKK